MYDDSLTLAQQFELKCVIYPFIRALSRKQSQRVLCTIARNLLIGRNLLANGATGGAVLEVQQKLLKECVTSPISVPEEDEVVVLRKTLFQILKDDRCLIPVDIENQIKMLLE